MRQFFIIGHNPNTVADAVSCLQAGANALEPDIHSIDGAYYMGEGTSSTDLSLEDYLQGLAVAFETSPELTPALVMFDTKNSDGDIAALFESISANFSNQFADTAIMITRSQGQQEEFDFFEPGAMLLSPNRALGIDEHTDPFYADSFFKALNVPNYTYADGISIQVPFLADIYKGRIKKAIQMRDKGNSFKLVYSWTIDSESEIEGFLKLNPDGLITDDPARLKTILTTQFSDTLQLAQVGYNPFG